GLQYHTTVNDWHTCPEGGEIRASNPCSEYMFLDDTACNLASLNLLTFLDRHPEVAAQRPSKDGSPGTQDTGRRPSRLASLAPQGDGAKFNVESYEHAVRLWTVVLEVSVMMAQFPSREIAELSYQYRTLGLGYANIGGLLMTSGIAYDSQAGRAIAGALTAIMTGISYATSAEMAEKLGPFPGYEKNREPMLRLMRNHCRA